VTTRHFSVSSHAAGLEVNVEIHLGGSFSMEVLDEEGAVMRGYTQSEFHKVIGNGGVHQRVRWGGPSQDHGIITLRDHRIALRFHLQRTDLFAFQFLR